MDFRRYYVPNAIVFITQVVEGRHPVFADEAHVELLRTVLRRVKELHPFAVLGYVFLPQHLHVMLLPTGDSNFSQIMHSLKPNYTKAYKRAVGITGSLKFWQKRFYDHIIRDETDFARHLDYVHYNPVKHRLVTRPEDWPHSSFQAWKVRGAYPDTWGWSVPPSLVDFDEEMGE
jgi:putative transposase